MENFDLIFHLLTVGIIPRSKLHSLSEFLSLHFAPTILPAQNLSPLLLACLNLTLPVKAPLQFHQQQGSPATRSTVAALSPWSPSGTYSLYFPCGSCRAQPSNPYLFSPAM